jgi:hypothetical protein
MPLLPLPEISITSPVWVPKLPGVLVNHFQCKMLIECPLVFFCLCALAVDKPCIDNGHAQDRMVDSIAPVVHFELALQVQRGLAMPVALINLATGVIADPCG